MLFVITGPSGCGKSTLVRRVLERMENVQFSVSHTTRKKRDSEEEGRDYYFISKSEFNQMVEDERFVEWAKVHGNYYGTSKREIERKSIVGDLLLDVDVQGAQQVKSNIKKAIFVFVLPPSFPELKRRLKERGQESAASTNIRLDVARREIRAYPEFDYIIINDQLDKAIMDLEAIILSKRCRLESRTKEVVPILRSFSDTE